MDQVVILVALLFILIFMLSLIVAEQCTWIRRLSSSSSSTASSTLPPQHQMYSVEAANKGVKKKTLCSLPKLTFSSCSSSENSTDCTICLTEFVNGDELRMLPQCGHAFHVACIDMWLGSHSPCPSCRRILIASGLPVMDRNKSHSRCEQCRGDLISSSSSNPGPSV